MRTWKNPFFVNCKKHFCPDCGKELGKVKVSKIVNWRSEEAKDFDFSFGDGYMIGDVKFTWTEFQCSNCQKNFKIEEIRQIEKKRRKEKRRNKG